MCAPEIDAQRIVPHRDVEQLTAADAEVERQADTMAAQLLNPEYSARHGGGAALLLLKLHAADAVLRWPELYIGTGRVDLDCVERIGKQQEAAGRFNPLGWAHRRVSACGVSARSCAAASSTGPAAATASASQSPLPCGRR